MLKKHYHTTGNEAKYFQQIKFIFLRLLTLMTEYVLSFECNIKDTTKANPMTIKSISVFLFGGRMQTHL